MKKPVLSAANTVRGTVIPPNARRTILPFVVPVPRRSQVVEEPDLPGRFVHEDLDGRLVARGSLHP